MMKLNFDSKVDHCDTQEVSTRSWRSQLLRLVKEAPRPNLVECATPRLFPHFENNRISESSWTSDTTRVTNMTLSSSDSDEVFGKGEGVNNDNQTVVFEDSSSFNPGFSENTKKRIDTVAVLPAEKGEEAVNATRTEMECNREELELSSTSPQKDSNITTKHQNGHHSRNTLSLSIQGDSEYWEKFRYSKDYQSSLMIETICNEVFNLKPSPRYKSLMQLSLKNKDTNRRLRRAFTQLPHDDENEVKVVEEGRTKEDIKTISEKDVKVLCEGMKEDADDAAEKVEEVEKNVSNPIQLLSADDDDGKTKQGLPVKEMRRYYSTPSSVFTTTTEEGDWDEDYGGMMERDKLLKGFGQAFHGYLTKGETEMLLKTDGQYLIRQMWNEDEFILSFRFDGEIRNYRIICEASSSSGSNVLYTYHLEDRRKSYYTLDELVREGLITLHLDENAGSYIDLLVELAQFQRDGNLLQSPPAVSPGSRKTSRSASFRTTRVASSSSAIISGGGDGFVDATERPSITVTFVDGRNSTDIALVIHYFDEETFDGLAKCQVCLHGLWGPSNKGLRCRDCCLSIHESCLDNVKSDCKPDLSTTPPFATDLTTLVKGSYAAATSSYSLPYVLEKCINEVEKRGLSTEGIYRVSGAVEEIEGLKTLFEKGMYSISI
ncbi:unnamed protein product [Orchesella dallaii]|uniref:N-chimaerin n=1 Tax=Orchesella dallaii TaxID=48710 RepID=A0ABP1S2Z5_9HEXA